jgi:hypothetical protein
MIFSNISSSHPAITRSTGVPKILAIIVHNQLSIRLLLPLVSVAQSHGDAIATAASFLPFACNEEDVVIVGGNGFQPPDKKICSHHAGERHCHHKDNNDDHPGQPDATLRGN